MESCFKKLIFKGQTADADKIMELINMAYTAGKAAGGGEMSKTNKEIYEWQQRFQQQPRIYFTKDKKYREIQNFYDSREAAQCEVEYEKKIGCRMTVGSMNIHNLALAKERWLERSAAGKDGQ